MRLGVAEVLTPPVLAVVTGEFEGQICISTLFWLAAWLQVSTPNVVAAERGAE